MSLQNHPNFYAIIPAHVRYCKELEPAAKLLYGEITALSSKEGYCWASNEYFAELYDVETRTIQRWLETLKKIGFIEVEIKKEGMKSSRKIWISQEIQKMFATRQNCHPRDDIRHDKNVVVDTAKMSSIVLHDTNNKDHHHHTSSSLPTVPPDPKKNDDDDSSKKTKEPDIQVTNSKGQKIGMSYQEVYEKLSRFDRSVVKEAIEKMLSMETPISNIIGYLESTCISIENQRSREEKQEAKKEQEV